jgi:ABC-type phosphate/phosphonate transport system substrate-binding protein
LLSLAFRYRNPFRFGMLKDIRARIRKRGAFQNIIYPSPRPTAWNYNLKTFHKRISMLLGEIKPGLFTSVAILGIILQSTSTSHGARTGGEEPFAPHIGYTSNSFVEVNINDAQLLAGRLTDYIASKRKGKADTRIYTSMNGIESDLNSMNLDLIVLVGNEFVMLKSKSLLEPLFVAARGNDIYEQLVLLVRKDSGIRTFKELRGRTLINHRGQFAEIKNIWLETLVMRAGERDINKYFKFSKEVMKPSHAVLAVYFKQADFCVVTRNNFDVASELNPQLHKHLTIITESLPFAGGIVAIRKDYSHRNREIIRDILEKLHQDVQGQQLLTIFHKNKLVPFRPEYLTSLEAFLKEYSVLNANSARRH